MQPMPIGLDTTMVFILSGWDAKVAADFERMKLQRLQKCGGDVFVEEDLVAHVENTMLGLGNECLGALFDDLDANGKAAAARAVRHCVEHSLFKYTVEQNCTQGLAPSRDQLAAAGMQALAYLPSDAPQQIVDRCRTLLDGDARGVRKWLAHWRKRWGGRLGKLKAIELLPTHIVHQKAGHPQPITRSHVSSWAAGRQLAPAPFGISVMKKTSLGAYRKVARTVEGWRRCLQQYMFRDATSLESRTQLS